ncbi:MAG: hypothetical protein DRI95_07480 [Bacteroidetes bacterium]|nr:MAG: hypothetical protein DRI95_07480 [Bacteroidota bacterium]
MILFGFKIRKRVLTFIVVFHSLLLSVFSLYLLNLPYIYEDELRLIQITSAIKKFIISKEEKPDRNRFLFVNIAWEKQLIEKLDTDEFPIGNQAITSRKSLAEFFKRINQKPENHKYLICDISFVDPSEDDKQLQAEFDKMINYTVSYHKDENDIPQDPILNVRKSISDYTTFNVDKFIKFKLVQSDSLITTPLKIYQDIYNKKVEHAFLYCLDNHYILNSFIVDFRIWSYDLSDNSSYKYDYINIGDFKFLPDSAFHKLLKNRIILIGDFELTDIHETIYGDMSGPLILLNTFLAIEKGENRLSVFYLIFIFISFIIINYYVFDINIRFKEHFSHLIAKSPIYNEMLRFFLYLVYFSIISSISFFMFNIHMTILLFSGYMSFLDIMNNYFADRRAKKKVIQDNVFFDLEDEYSL